MYSSYNRSLSTVFLPDYLAEAGRRAHELNPGELGVIDCDTGLTVDAASYYTDKRYQVIYKSYSKGNTSNFFPDILGIELPIRSLEISKIDKSHLFDEADKPALPHISYLGYDGLNKCKTLDFPCGEDLSLQITVKGKTVRNVFNKNYTVNIPFSTGCCEDCSDYANSCTIADNIMEAFTNDPFYAHNYLQMNIVKSCCPELPPFDKKPYKEWELTVCDAGSNADLTKVQRQLEKQFGKLTEAVCRTERDNPFSTYQICLKDGLTPEDFVLKNTKHLVCDECPSCPDTFTKVEPGDKYIACYYSPLLTDTTDAFELDYYTDPTTAQDTIDALIETYAGNVPGYVAESADFVSKDCDKITLSVCVAEGTDLKEHGIAGLEFTSVGKCVGYCEGEQAFPWCPGKDLYRVEATKCILFKKDDCIEGEVIDETSPLYLEVFHELFGPKADPTDTSGELHGTGNLVVGSLEIESQSNCLIQFKVNQCSQCLEDGCDYTGETGAKFPNIPATQGQIWKVCECEGWTLDDDGCPVPPSEDNPDCCIGLRFEGAIVDPDCVPCSYDINDNIDVEPLEIVASIIRKPEYDFDLCDPIDVPRTVVQQGRAKLGDGRFIAKEERLSREYDLYEYTSGKAELGNLIGHRKGYVYNADQKKCYNRIILWHNYYCDETHASSSHQREQIIVLVDANKVDLFNELIDFFNKTLLSHGHSKLLKSGS